MIQDPSKELWKDIKGYEGHYQVSSLGRVRNIKKKPFYILSVRNDCSWGYVFVTLNKNGISKNYKLHRLVAKTFISNTTNKKEVNHKDGNKNNNRADNLEWVTRSENQKHAFIIGLIDFSARKKPIVQLKNGIEIARYKSATDIQSTIGYLACNVCKCCKGKIKTYKGFEWRYI